jgi:choice-of-anchor B domain-containing protein
MKILITSILLLVLFGATAQNSLNMTLGYQWSDSTLVASTGHSNTYNEIWGYEKEGIEYAIIGTTAGTHIFDITDLNNVDTVAFIPGKAQGDQIVHRDYDTYRDHLYIVSDEGASSLQIADLSFLPDSAPVVYDADTLIRTSHNIFIDTLSGSLYTCGGATNLGANFLSVYSLTADPAQPQFVLNCGNDVPFWNGTIGYVHDIFVRNDTAYCNAGEKGLFVVDFSDLGNVQGLGSLTSYTQQGYNHSGWLHESGDYYAFADENNGLDVKIVDVSNLSDITLIDTIGANTIESLSMAHNLIFKDDNLYVSHYFDGIYVFNTADVNNISLAGYYQTSQSVHANNVYQGCWGIYPFLSSGKILASDMQEGLFVLNTNFPNTIIENSDTRFNFIVYPNPTRQNITVTTTLLQDALAYSIIDLSGRVVKNGTLVKAQTSIGLTDVAQGFYAFSITKKDGTVLTKKFIKE